MAWFSPLILYSSTSSDHIVTDLDALDWLLPCSILIVYLRNTQTDKSPEIFQPAPGLPDLEENADTLRF